MIVHCGVQKTASTSLHHFLQRNADALAGTLDVFTPVKGSLTRRLGRAAMQFSLDPSPERRAVLTGLASSLRDLLLEGDGPALVSHENLLGAMIGKGGVVTLYPEMERIVALLDRALAPLVPDYAIYTRDMAAWKPSVHQQAVRSDGYTGSLADFLTETEACGTWDELEARMGAQLGKDRLRVFRLEDERDQGRPGAQLLGFAGLRKDRIEALSPLRGRSNPRLNGGALEFLRLVNQLGLEAKVRARIVDLVASNQSLFATGGA